MIPFFHHSPSFYHRRSFRIISLLICIGKLSRVLYFTILVLYLLCGRVHISHTCRHLFSRLYKVYILFFDSCSLSTILENKTLTMNFNLEGKRFLVTGAGGGRNGFLYKKILIIINDNSFSLFYVQNMTNALFSFI